MVFSACGDIQERLSGYPSRDTAINVETASPSQIAAALSQMAHIAVLGKEWKFLNPQDMCTVHVLSPDSQQYMALPLQGASFALQRDAHSKNYYTAIQLPGSAQIPPAPLPPLRLFETAAYHEVFFAEGYLQALVDKCEQSRIRMAQHAPKPLHP